MAPTMCAKCKREWQANSGSEPCPWCKATVAEAKLAAAVEALRKAETWTDRIHSALAESMRPKQAVGEMVYGLLVFLRSILSGHAPAPAPATSQQAAPSEREKRLEEALLDAKDRISESVSHEFERWEIAAFLRELRDDMRAALADTTKTTGG